MRIHGCWLFPLYDIYAWRMGVSSFCGQKCI
jgi:hypothetical protein